MWPFKNGMKIHLGNEQYMHMLFESYEEIGYNLDSSVLIIS